MKVPWGEGPTPIHLLCIGYPVGPVRRSLANLSCLSFNLQISKCSFVAARCLQREWDEVLRSRSDIGSWTHAQKVNIKQLINNLWLNDTVTVPTVSRLKFSSVASVGTFLIQDCYRRCLSPLKPFKCLTILANESDATQDLRLILRLHRGL